MYRRKDAAQWCSNDAFSRTVVPFAVAAFWWDLSFCGTDFTCTSRTNSKFLEMLPGHVSGSRSWFAASQPYISLLKLGAALSISNSALYSPFRVAEIFPGKKLSSMVAEQHGSRCISKQDLSCNCIAQYQGSHRVVHSMQSTCRRRHHTSCLRSILSRYTFSRKGKTGRRALRSSLYRLASTRER